MRFCTREPIPAVVSQHLEDAAALRLVRSVLVRAPHVRLLQLGRADERIAAHLDGISVAGNDGARMGRQALDRPGVGELFIATVVAIERREQPQLDKLLALFGVVPDAPRAMASAFGWVSASWLRGLMAPLLSAGAGPAARWLGIAACALHRVDPGAALEAAIAQAHAGLRARALRAAGELGRADLLPVCLDHLADDDGACRVAAAESAVLLGDRGAALQAVHQLALAPAPTAHSEGPLALALLGARPDAARSIVHTLASAKAPRRLLIQAAGWAGDPQAVPWLIEHMTDDAYARVAGEAFALVTGLDLAFLDLDREAPEGHVSGPSDDPADDDVALDDDESLPWPDVTKIGAWWRGNGARFAAGTRFFMGQPPTSDHVVDVLRGGFQRQRSLAAKYRCLLQPGTPLFATRAPTWRQKRWLNQLGGAGGPGA